MSHQEYLLKEFYLICLICYQNGCNSHVIGVQRSIVDFLCFNICWSDSEAWFIGKRQVDSIDLTY